MKREHRIVNILLLLWDTIHTYIIRQVDYGSNPCCQGLPVQIRT